MSHLEGVNILTHEERAENQSGKDEYPNRKLRSQAIHRVGEGRAGWSLRTQEDASSHS